VGKQLYLRLVILFPTQSNFKIEWLNDPGRHWRDYRSSILKLCLLFKISNSCSQSRHFIFFDLVVVFSVKCLLQKLFLHCNSIGSLNIFEQWEHVKVDFNLSIFYCEFSFIWVFCLGYIKSRYLILLLVLEIERTTFLGRIFFNILPPLKVVCHLFYYHIKSK
jgi:hypothetical protein